MRKARASFPSESKLGWIGLDWVGLDWIGLDWIGLNWIGLDRAAGPKVLHLKRAFRIGPFAYDGRST